MLKICLFGSIIIEQDGGRLPLPASAQARDLLAYLALFRERKHARSLLVGSFWPDQPEERARRLSADSRVHCARQKCGSDRDPDRAEPARHIPGLLHAEEPLRQEIRDR